MDVREKLESEMRLIDANSLLDEFLKKYTEMERDGNLVFAACEIKQDFADMISNVPNVDAVEVVRCRECKYHNKPPCPMRLSFNWTEDNDFCSYGERKEGAD